MGAYDSAYSSAYDGAAVSTGCSFSDGLDSGFEICTPAVSDPHPIRRVIVSQPRIIRIPAEVDSEIVVVSTAAPHVEQRFVLIPSVLAGEIPITIVGMASASVLRGAAVGSSADLAAVGMIRASIDNDAEVLALALGVSFEMAQELV